MLKDDLRLGVFSWLAPLIVFLLELISSCYILSGAVGVIGLMPKLLAQGAGLSLALGLGQLLLIRYLLLWLLAWLASSVSVVVFSRYGSFDIKQIGQISLLLFLLFYLCCVFINFVEYPYSQFGGGYTEVMSDGLAHALYWVSFVLLFAAFIFAVIVWLFGSVLRRWIFGLSLLVCLTAFISPFQRDLTPKNIDKPNIIIIGIDSLRADFQSVDYGQNAPDKLLDFFLSSSSFTRAYTPIGRTYGAWYSILSGKYPVTSGVRYNLQPAVESELKELLPHRLQQLGYSTMFATDERRFSNIDERYGFDQVVGSKVGAVDFVSELLTDSPTSNLLVNTPVGKYLFPYSYGNRAHARLYRPDVFVGMVDGAIGRLANSDKPMFISAHFCLAHWPFSWGDMESREGVSRYVHSLSRVDKMFADFMEVLKGRGLLKNSWVYVLSDHGESFSGRLSGEGFHDAVTAHGHGTNILSLSQYQVAFGVRRYVDDEVVPLDLDTEKPIVLLDLTPSIAETVGISMDTDGESIFSETPIYSRPIFLESGLVPKSWGEKMVVLEDILTTALLSSYRVNSDTGYLEVIGESYEAIVKKKQRGVILNGLLYAKGNSSGFPFREGVVDLNTGEVFRNDNFLDFPQDKISGHKLKLEEHFNGDNY